MKYTMVNVEGFHRSGCLAIAANQLGENKQIVVMSRYPKNWVTKHKFFDILINPEITNLSEETSILWEGCLSDKK